MKRFRKLYAISVLIAMIAQTLLWLLKIDGVFPDLLTLYATVNVAFYGSVAVASAALEVKL